MRILSTLIVAAGAAALASCGGSDDSAAANAAAENAAAAAAAAKPKHPTYCFFPDAANDVKGLAAKAGKDGNVVVTGKARLEDRRYMAALAQPDVSGTGASIWLTMPQNTTGFGAPDNWWELSATIPDSSAVTDVTVMCGTTTLATLTIPRSGETKSAG